MSPRPLKVFLCHAHADRDAVRGLYTRLTKDGVDAWLDKEKLLPRQDWELEIKKAVREADVVVVCLSKQFNQAGFRQKEVRLALDTAMEKPEGEIFIIPARLEECDNLESLKKWHEVDLFEENGYEGLFSSIKKMVGNSKNLIKPQKSSNSSVRKLQKNTLNNVSVNIDGNVLGSTIVIGDKNVINIEGEKELTDTEYLDIRSKYLNQFINKYATPEKPTILELGEYVPLPINLIGSQTIDGKEESYDSIISIPNLPKKWILLGDAGAGKTATIRGWSCFYAKQCLKNSDLPIPVLINLWTWRGNSSTFSNFFEDFVKDASNQDLIGLLRSLQSNPIKLLQHNKVALFLDGLDELPDSKVRLLKDWLSKTELTVGITCRETDFIGIRKLEFPVYSLRPIEWDQITIFAHKFLGKETGTEFVSNILEAKAGERMYEEHHLFRFVQTPFFLLLILAYYKQIGKVEFNRWRLFEYIIAQLWEKDRIQELISAYKLDRYYGTPSQIVKFLSGWGLKFIDDQIIERKQFESNTDVRLLEVLVESTLIQMNEDQIRFRHPLFADYIAAHGALEWAEYRHLSDDITKWAGMLVVLAGFSEITRQKVQKFLINTISSRTGWESLMEEKRGELWILGEIGDDNAIPPLINLHNNTKDADNAWMWFSTSSINHVFAGTSCLTAAGRISRRLPENNKVKEDFIQVVANDLFSKPNWRNRESDSTLDDPENKVYGWMLRQHNLLTVLNSVLAIGEMGGEQASKLFYSALIHFNEYYPSSIMWSNNVRVLGFSVALARLGILGIPTLLEILSSEDSQISHVAADALYILSYPLPLKPLFKLLALHPDSVVRISVARKLGRSKNIEVIPYLVAALNDKGSVTRSHPMERWNAHYFYVADSAAEALAAIGTEKCISIIKERLYNPDGSISIELSLERLREWTETKLRTYEARRILQQNGLLSLLPLMGHLNDVEPSMNDPIAEAIIYHHKNNMGGNVVSQLLHYLSSSEDALSRKWALIVLGTIGNVYVEEVLNKFLSSEYDPVVRDGAVRGLGLLISRYLDVYSEHDILSKLIPELGKSPASSYGSVGWGVSEIVRAYADIQSTSALNVIRTVLDHFLQGNLENSKSALDALESICIKISQSYIKDSEMKKELVAFVEQKIMPILIESPSYLMKMAKHFAVEGESSNNIDETIKAFAKVVEKKENPPAWALQYTESDWIQLGCSDIEVQYRLGDILYEANRYRESLEHYDQVLKIFNQKEYQNQYLLSLFCKSLNKVGLLHIYFEEFKQAIGFFRQITDIKNNPAVDDYLLLNAWNGLQRAYSEEKQWLELLETAMETLNLVDKTYGRYLDRCAVRINIGSAYVELGEFDKALMYWQETENLADFYGLHEILVELIFHRSSLYLTLGREDLVESDFEKAESYYKEIEDWAKAASVIGQLSEKVFKNDPVKRISLFQRALSYLDLLQSPSENHDHAFFFYKVALTYQELNDNLNAELNFQKALGALEKQKISELEAYIWIDYGKFLHGIGRSEEGERFAVRGIAVQSELGLDESYGEKTLREMSSNPEWRIPSAILFIMFNTIINSLTTGLELTDDVLKRLEDMLDRARDQGWKEEEELLISLHSVASRRMSKLPESNPYFEPFCKFELALKNAMENKKNVEQDGITIIQLLEQVERVLRGDRELGQKLFSFTQKMAVSSDNPPEIQAFGRALTNILAGNRNPNLNELTEEFALAIRIMLERVKN